MKIIAAGLFVGLLFVGLLGKAGDVIVPPSTTRMGVGTIASKPVPDLGFAFTVGTQSNGESFSGNGIVWGLAAEATANSQANDWLVGIEALVINANPGNRGWITANNAVIGCRTLNMILNNIPCAGPNNVNSRAYWITSHGPETGFESGIKFDTNSLLSMPGRPKPAVIDLRDVPDEKLAGWCVIATRTRCITIDELR